MRRVLLILLALILVCCPLSHAKAEGEDTGSWRPSKTGFPVEGHIDAWAKLGSDRRLTGTEAFLPLSWNGQYLSFLDLRFVADDADGREGNAGLGVRRVADDRSHILGGYAFFDRRRSSTGHLYNQVTTGVEFLTQDWDVRANGYIPLTGTKELASSNIPLTTSVTLSGTGLVATSGFSDFVMKEHQYSGVDGEIGRKLPFLEKTWFEETRAFVGAYRFTASDVKTMFGARLRIEAAPLEWLRFGAEYQKDSIRAGTGFIEARIRVPLDFWSDKPSTAYAPKPPIYKRLDTRIVRDVDVVTQTQTQGSSQSATTDILNVTTGDRQKVYIVDNTAAPGGDGSVERPFSTLVAAQAAAGAHDFIYVKAGDSTSAGMNAGIVLNAHGQRLIGTGVPLAYDASIMQAPGLAVQPANGLVILPATTAPAITNTAGNGVEINAANGVEVAGLNINDATNNGIAALNANNLTLRNITVTGSANDGVRIEANGAASNISDTSITSVNASSNTNGLHLIAANDASLTAKIERSAFTNNAQYGVVVFDNSEAGNIAADLGGGAQGSPGLNSIHGNALQDLALDTDGVPVSAQNNWWGQAGGPLASKIFFGPNLQQNLVAHWTFDADKMSAGMALDSSGNGYTGTLQGGMTADGNSVAGVLGQAMHFNGIDNNITAGDIPAADGTNVFTLSYWTNPIVAIGSTPISKWDDTNWNQTSWGVRGANGVATEYLFFVGTGIDPGNNYMATTNLNLANGVWQQITIVFDGAQAAPEDRLKIYKNGVQVSVVYTGLIETTIRATTANVNIGASLCNNPTFCVPYQGALDDVRIYNRALAPAEISDLYAMSTNNTVQSAGALDAPPP